MFPFTPTGITFKIFVKETEPEPKGIETGRKNFPVTPLTGDKAKEFYEDVLKEPSSSSPPPKVKKYTKPKPKPVRKKPFKDADLLRMAQNNDVKNLKIFLTQNPDRDLNVVDEFGWTPLMCASCSGAEEAVEMLLENGADPTVRDRLGNTASELARQKNHANVVERLENPRGKPDGAEPERESVEPFFCSVCKENSTMGKIKHESSTLHLFNSRLKCPTFYGIPECNRGFQLLLREGWDKEKGLGRDGTGRKFPVKAVMKKDRLGIGAPPPPAEDKRQTQPKKKKTYDRWREKDFEKNFRLEFS